ncbi:thiamine-phosphate pyrophosphorylase [Chitinophaga costaii]|uniref:Thiamine-phosphate pyrophosphorylase n=1 Tax=Chitinophaga costaii TaxID=1335309 RepID=A0A1C4FLJ7_9BACT|nr:thiamine phosphate synthase [Chitinophaga costaii]PUZ29960.1 thiamine phosphate synthase [Chitinophaga costaii]SCC56868.1 thiamine-phosphate pyrophosphorylase [Chitinophaga costaii]
MLMVVSHPHILEEEATYINALFDAGLQRLHLRKPYASEEAIKRLLEQVEGQYYAKIAWHQYHHLAIRYGTKRIHFPEYMRLRYDDPVWKLLKDKQYILSTSVHAHTHTHRLAPEFSYAFVGPVFDSISKTGYKALEAATRKRLLMADLGVARVAIGGIGGHNCQLLQAMGVRSIAVSGAVWQSGTPLEAFKKIQAVWHTTGPSF